MHAVDPVSGIGSVCRLEGVRGCYRPDDGRPFFRTGGRRKRKAGSCPKGKRQTGQALDRLSGAAGEWGVPCRRDGGNGMTGRPLPDRGEAVFRAGGFPEKGAARRLRIRPFWVLRLVFLFYESAQTLDALEWDVVFFHQFFQVVPFFCNEVLVAVRFRQPDDVTANDSVNGVEFHDAVFTEVGDVCFVFDEFFPFVQVIVHVASLH